MLSETLGPKGTLFDVGAGAGRYTAPIARRGFAVTAVEPSAGMRRNLEERDGQWRWPGQRLKATIVGTV